MQKSWHPHLVTGGTTTNHLQQAQWRNELRERESGREEERALAQVGKIIFQSLFSLRNCGKKTRNKWKIKKIKNKTIYAS